MSGEERHEPRRGLEANLAIARKLENGNVMLMVMTWGLNQYGIVDIYLEPVTESLQILN